ncbi:MAG: DUF3822 family protein [Bacteroidales bacterium]|nr:DUF3822 family protein [Bacteroidales bacterium]
MSTLLSSYYTKSIRLAPNGFSLFNQNEKGEIVREDYLTAENVLLTNEAPKFFNIESNENMSIDIIVATRVPMLIPDIIFKDEQARDYLQMQHDVSQFGKHYTDALGNYRSLYFLTQNEFDTISKLGCVPHFKSEATLLYEFLMRQDNEEAVMLSVNDTFVDIIALHGKQPALVNRLTRIEPVDILYYTLNCTQQFGLSAPTLFVHYFTKTNKKLNDLLKQYHNDVIFL